ncbi:MAG: RDD family protein [Bacteroidales bacterium]|nr:RDD family protein [Bacteroidales bacterium]
MNYAGFWIRFLATLIDGIVIATFVGIVVNLIGGAQQASLSYSLFMLAAQWGYYSLMESSERQATLGKIVLGLRVTDLQGNRISFGKATARFFGKVLSGLLLFIGYIMVAFTDKKQGLHDKLVSTLVLK